MLSLSIHRSHSRHHRSFSNIHRSHSRHHRSLSNIHRSHSNIHRSHSNIHRSHSRHHRSFSNIHRSHPNIHRSHSNIHRSHFRHQRSHFPPLIPPSPLPPRKRGRRGSLFFDGFARLRRRANPSFLHLRTSHHTKTFFLSPSPSSPCRRRLFTTHHRKTHFRRTTAGGRGWGEGQRANPSFLHLRTSHPTKTFFLSPSPSSPRRQRLFTTTISPSFPHRAAPRSEARSPFYNVRWGKEGDRGRMRAHPMPRNNHRIQ